MFAYTVKRLFATIPIMAIVATIVFLIMHMGANDPAAVMAGESATQEQIAAIRERFGFDLPVWQQFFVWVGQLLQGNLGESIYTRTPVAQMIGQRLESTVSLAVLAMGFAILIAIPLGTVAAWKAGSWIDRAVMVFAVSAFSFPVFLVAYTLVLMLAIEWRVLPVQGYRTIAAGVGPWLQHLILPSVSLGLGFAALLARITRASLLEALRQDFIRTARAKGLGQFKVIVGHGLRNAAVPITTVIGLGVAGLISGVVITETVFALPGIGRLTVDGILHRDYPLVQGCVLFFSFSYVFINVAVDLAYAALDPRIRY